MVESYYLVLLGSLSRVPYIMVEPVIESRDRNLNWEPERPEIKRVDISPGPIYGKGHLVVMGGPLQTVTELHQ